MPEHPHFEDDSIVNPETHHEESDVNVRALVTFVVIFVVFAAVVHVALWLLFRFYVAAGKSSPPPRMTQIERPAGADVPAQPRLQPLETEQSPKPGAATRSPIVDTPVADMELMRANEDRVLNNPGWVDRQKGIVHIPIKQAKELALQRGLYPVNSSTAAPPAVPAPVAAKSAATAVSNPTPAVHSTTTGTQQQ